MLPAKLFGQEDWQQLNPANAPDARFGHSLVTMPDGRGILYGGEDSLGELFDDLHIFEQDTWNQVIPAGGSPSARRDHRAWVRGDFMMIFGGFGNSGELLNDLWSFDPTANTWSQIAYTNDPPDPRTNHAAWSSGGKDYILGGVGENGFAKSDIWVFDPSTGTWEKKTRCPSQVDDAAVVNYGEDAYILAYSPYVLSYNTAEDKWYDRSVADPKPPKLHSILYQRGAKLELGTEKATAAENILSTNNAWLFGGMNNEDSIMNTTWCYDFTTESYSQHTDLPVGLAKGASAWIGDQIMIFGGVKEDGSVSGETFLFTPSNTNVGRNEALPKDFSLLQNFPNPFNPKTAITYSMRVPCRVVLKVFDLSGREVMTLVDANQHAGSYTIQVDMDGLVSGIYFYQIRMKDFMDGKKMALME